MKDFGCSGTKDLIVLERRIWLFWNEGFAFVDIYGVEEVRLSIAWCQSSHVVTEIRFHGVAKSCQTSWLCFDNPSGFPSLGFRPLASVDSGQLSVVVTVAELPSGV